MKAAARAAWDAKAEDIVVIDVTGRISYADHFILCSGQHVRHTAAIADRIVQALREQHGARPLGVEGKEVGRWVLLDYGDFLVHVLDQTSRSHYDLDGLWADAPRLTLAQLGIEPATGGGTITYTPQPFSTVG